MRWDMGRCVLEAPRRGHHSRGFKSRNFGRMVDRGDGVEYEGPLRIPNSMNYGQRAVRGPKSWDDKSFSDCLGPINGYLLSKVGQPWNNVHSEICQVLGRNAPWPIQHILHAHIDVEENCYETDAGDIRMNTSKQWWRHGGKVYGLYVHPRTGILCYEPEGSYNRGRGPGSQKRPKKQEPVTEICNGPGGWCYQKIGGLWFKIQYRKVVVPQWKRNMDDYRRGGPNAGHIEEVEVDQVVCKRSCNRKDLKWLRSQPGVL